jgi:protein-S-isoprenylcysteine O-methyltransferase Ste14
VIRDPGYAGMILSSPAGAVILGSYWALIPGLIFSALAARRVVDEDAFLQRNLDGYSDYATRVPFRLIPGVW